MLIYFFSFTENILNYNIDLTFFNVFLCTAADRQLIVLFISNIPPHNSIYLVKQIPNNWVFYLKRSHNWCKYGACSDFLYRCFE
jgi:hypothetical protein